MERIPFHDLRQEELFAVILRLQERLAVLEARDRQQKKLIEGQTKLIEQQASRIAELEKKNPTQRLDEAYSVRAEEKRQADAQQGGKSKRGKNKSSRRG